MEQKRLGRRGFLGVSATAVAVVGAGVPLLTRGARGAASWEDLEGFPDMPTAVRVDLPEPEVPLRLRVKVRLEAPGETIEWDAGEVTLATGASRVALELAYPYDQLVAGRYRYTATFEGDGLRLVTSEPAIVEVTDMAWLS